MNEKSYNLCLNNDTHIGTIFGTDYKVDEDNYDLGEGVEAIKYLSISRNEKKSVKYCTHLISLTERDKENFLKKTEMISMNRLQILHEVF